MKGDDALSGVRTSMMCELPAVAPAWSRGSSTSASHRRLAHTDCDLADDKVISHRNANEYMSNCYMGSGTRGDSARLGLANR